MCKHYHNIDQDGYGVCRYCGQGVDFKALQLKMDKFKFKPQLTRRQKMNIGTVGDFRSNPPRYKLNMRPISEIWGENNTF